MKCFLTGSRCYGIPRDDSDVDIVISVDENDCRDRDMFKEIRNLADEIKEYSELSASFRFGSLNLIVTRDAHQYAAWLEGTAELRGRRPVDRETAVETMKRHGVK